MYPVMKLLFLVTLINKISLNILKIISFLFSFEMEQEQSFYEQHNVYAGRYMNVIQWTFYVLLKRKKKNQVDNWLLKTAVFEWMKNIFVFI